jgi:glycosyltransferase involved in cell wall biosynthesis
VSQVSEMLSGDTLCKVHGSAERFATANKKECNGAGMTTNSSGENTAAAKVAILLCTYHGQRFLAGQLDSFAAQTHSNWVVWASDDGSKDATHDILERYRAKWGDERLSIHCGPAEGFAANFLSLTCKADIAADYFAYSDQDDIWEADKLQRALEWLSTVPEGVPALYCSRTLLVDGDDCEIGLSPLFPKKPDFANALVQSIGGGNTMVFNMAASQLLRDVCSGLSVLTHDWWNYLVISGCGGKVFYDAHPSLRYRQHSGNLVGMNSSWMARLTRIRMLFQGRFRQWNDEHIASLQLMRDRLTPENRQLLDLWATSRNRWLLPRMWGLWKTGIYRQTIFGNVGLIVAAIFKKI